MPRGKGGDARPRGRMTAYAFFVQTCREEHKKKHPEENVVFAEFSKKCAERWKVSLDYTINISHLNNTLQILMKQLTVYKYCILLRT